jgi:uncharacterized protein with PIN domain
VQLEDDVQFAVVKDPCFACDSMLGGLARWLRAAGYDASWHHGIDDRDLVHLARDQHRIILSSDNDVFEFSLVRDGVVPGLFVPRGQSIQAQLAHVLRELKLALRSPRCMACGGELFELTRENAIDRVPPRSLAGHDEFWECVSCQRVYWHGTHWKSIIERLQDAASGGWPNQEGQGPTIANPGDTYTR